MHNNADPQPVAPQRPARIALLIDADNSPASKIDVILAELAKAGVTNIRRAYGNWKKDGLKGWEGVLHEYAIKPIQQFDYSKGKNATDMCMVIDAMDLLYTDSPEAFGIVTSDCDFTPLVLHLKAKGALVVGFGAAKTPLPFVNACSRFLYLEHLGVDADVAAAKKKTAKADDVKSTPTGASLRRDATALRQDARLVALLRNAAEAAAGDDGWSRLSTVRQQVGNQASFDPRNYGYSTFSKLIAATQLFEIKDEGTSTISIRDKRHDRPQRHPAAPD